MKRKILAITLALVLLVSLFAFASPVVAKNDTNDNFFDVSFALTSGSTYFYSVSWHGPPATLTLPYPSDGPLETRIVEEGSIRIYAPYARNYVVTGDFGPEIGEQTGTADSVAHIVLNFGTGKIRGHRTIECDFGDGNTAKFISNTNQDMMYWSYPSGHPYDFAVRSNIYGNFTMISGTGIFGDLECTGISFGSTFEGVGH